MRFEIGRARTSDASWVAETLVQFMTEMSETDSTIAPSEDALKRIHADIGGWLGDSGRVIHIARADPLKVGLVHAQLWRLPPVYSGRDEVFVNEIYVVPEHRGNGVGKALIQSVVNWAQENGAAAIRATTLAANQGSNMFWKAVGGRPATTDYVVGIPTDPVRIDKKSRRIGF